MSNRTDRKTRIYHKRGDFLGEAATEGNIRTIRGEVMQIGKRQRTCKFKDITSSEFMVSEV